MRYIIILCLALASTLSFAGTLTIIPDSTSSMGLEKQRREAVERARAERQARIAAGIEQPAPVIIIKQAPPRPTQLNCYSYGNRNQFTSCQQY